MDKARVPVVDEAQALRNEIAELKAQNDALRFANKAWADECSRLSKMVTGKKKQAIELFLKAAEILNENPG